MIQEGLFRGLLTKELRDLSADRAARRLLRQLVVPFQRVPGQLMHVFNGHLHVLAVSLVTDGLDELDAVVEVPVHEVHDLPPDAHVGAVLLSPVLQLKVALEELAGDDDAFSLYSLIEPLGPGLEVPLVVLYRPLLDAALPQLHRKRESKPPVTAERWSLES